MKNFMFLCGLITFICLSFCGCTQMSDYSNSSLFPEEVESVYVEMFDNQSFWRGVEYELTDSLAKRIELETPYKIISNRNNADTVISGQIESINRTTLSSERQTGRALEKEVNIVATVNWKNLKTGELFIDSRSISASAS